MKNTNQFEFLYKKFLENQCTASELDTLFAHFKTESEQQLHKLIREELDSSNNQTNAEGEDLLRLSKVYDRIKSKIESETHQPTVKSFYQRHFYWLPAVAAILIFVSYVSWLYIAEQKHSPLQANSFVQGIVPGGNKAVLTLASGLEISLTDADNGELAHQNGTVITKTNNGQIVYDSTNTTDADLGAPALNKIETPRGGQYQIRLSDGTNVWLNAASTLHYPTVFSGKDRSVILSGEAYFEVAENKKMPFRVVSDHQVIEVLGTHFNVNAYADEKTINTTLLEGRVRVTNDNHSALLKPGQQAQVAQTIQLINVDIMESIAWKNGKTQFSNMDIKGIMRMLSRWYDVEVVYKGDIDARFGGSVSRTNNISDILKLLELTGDVQFKIEGRRIVVMP